MASSVYDLREFLDKMPSAPCVPKKEDPIFCSLCERLNPSVAQACKSGKQIVSTPVVDVEEPKIKQKEITIEIKEGCASDDEELVELEDEIPLVEGIHAKTSNINDKEVPIEVEPILVQTKDEKKSSIVQKERKSEVETQKKPQKGTVVRVVKTQKTTPQPQTQQTTNAKTQEPPKLTPQPQTQQTTNAKTHETSKTTPQPQASQQTTTPKPGTNVQSQPVQQMQKPAQSASVPVTQPTKFKKIVKK